MSRFLAVFPCLFLAGMALAVSERPGQPAVTFQAEQGPLDPAVFAEAVHKLADLGIIADSQYWIDNVRPGKFVPTTQLHPVVIAAANKFEETETIGAALEVLNRQRILMNKARWESELISKPKISAGSCSFLFITLAKSIN